MALHLLLLGLPFNSGSPEKMYERYAGLLFDSRAVQQRTLDNLDPLLVTDGSETHDEKAWRESFCRAFKHCIDLHRSVVTLPVDKYKCWCVAFHDLEGNTIARQDAGKDEIRRLVEEADNEGRQFLNIWREFVIPPQHKSTTTHFNPSSTRIPAVFFFDGFRVMFLKVMLLHQPPPPERVVLLAKYHGRLGNRMFSYAFAHEYARRYGLTCLLPCTCEIDVLFEAPSPNTVRSRVLDDDELRLRINQSAHSMDNTGYRMDAVERYGLRTGHILRYTGFDSPSDVGVGDCFFDTLNCMYYPHLFDVVDAQHTRTHLFRFSARVLESRLYRDLLERSSTYKAVAHVRRGDIVYTGYDGAHSAISLESYERAIVARGLDPTRDVMWICEDEQVRRKGVSPDDGWWYTASKVCAGGGWSFPQGQHEIPDVFFDFFPDFLAIHFAKIIFRGNSSFSWWAAFLGSDDDKEVYSPVMPDRKLCKGVHYVECEFVRGNHPHFMGNVEEGFQDICFSSSSFPN
jgi:hypothetical protein